MANNYGPWGDTQAEDINGFQGGQPYNTGQGMNSGPQPWNSPTNSYLDSFGGNSQSFNQTPRYNTDQGMTQGGFGGFGSLDQLAGNGGGGQQQQQQQPNPWEAGAPQSFGGGQGQQYNFGSGGGGNAFGGGQESNRGGLPMFGGGQGQPRQQSFNPYGQQSNQPQGAFDFNDPAQQDAFVRSLGASAPAIFGDNGHMTGQDWANRYDAIRQAAQGRPVESFGAPAAQQSQTPGNYYGTGGAQGFNELGGELAKNSDRFNEAFGKFGWNLVTPTGGSQDQAESIARAMAARDPNTDYEPVNMGGGQWNIATRSRLPGAGQPFTGLLPRPVMPPPAIAQAAAQRYSGGGGGGSSYAPKSYTSGGGGSAQNTPAKPWYMTAAPPPKGAPVIPQVPNSPLLQPGMPGYGGGGAPPVVPVGNAASGAAQALLNLLRGQQGVQVNPPANARVITRPTSPWG